MIGVYYPRLGRMSREGYTLRQHVNPRLEPVSKVPYYRCGRSGNREIEKIGKV